MRARTRRTVAIFALLAQLILPVPALAVVDQSSDGLCQAHATSGNPPQHAPAPTSCDGCALCALSGASALIPIISTLVPRPFVSPPALEPTARTPARSPRRSLPDARAPPRLPILA